jgi:flagellar hook-associated protein 3 FlgL
MAYRISQLQSTTSFIEQIMESRIALEDKRNEIATGYKVVDASDDPGRAGTISSLQSTVQRIDRHQERISFAVNLLQTQETVLSNANEILVRVQELGTQAANGTVSAEVRSQMADEVFELRDALAGLANTKYQGMYLYGGKADNSAPFELNDGAPFFYANPPDAAPAENPPEKTHWGFDAATPGRTDTRTVSISDNDNVRIISRGDEVFADAINSLEQLGRALRGYNTGLDGNGDPDGTGDPYSGPTAYDDQTADIQAAINAIDSARDNHIVTELSNIGARVNLLDQTKQILDTLKTNTEETRSTIQDTDMIAAASDFSNLQISLQGLLTAGSKINSLSLLNYI